jgi:hypothetical protein
LIYDAVDEFIEDKKFWFRELHKEHGDDLHEKAIEKGKNFMPNTALYIGKDVIPISGEFSEESLELKRLLKEKTLQLAA